MNLFVRLQLSGVQADLLNKKNELIQCLHPSDIFMLGHVSKICEPSVFKQFVCQVLEQKKDQEEEAEGMELQYFVP